MNTVIFSLVVERFQALSFPFFLANYPFLSLFELFVISYTPKIVIAQNHAWYAWLIDWLNYFCLQIPNGLGEIFGAFQLIVYACYYSSTTWEDEVNDKPQRELGPLPTTNPSSIAPRSEAWTRRRKKIGCFHHHSRSSHYPHDLFMLSRVVFRCSLFWVDTFCVGFLLFGLASCK